MGSIVNRETTLPHRPQGILLPGCGVRSMGLNRREVTIYVYLYTVNVDIFAQLNFRASSPMTHIRAVKFSCICCLFLFVLF